MTQRAISQVSVTYDDGTSETWTGRGNVDTNRTPSSGGQHPVPKDSDVSYVNVVLSHERPA